MHTLISPHYMTLLGRTPADATGVSYKIRNWRDVVDY